MKVRRTQLNKIISFVVISAVITAAGFLALATRPIDNIDYSAYSSKTISYDNGIQVIGMKANTGYIPNMILAKSNIPTRLKILTENTFDCTSVMSIPSLNIRRSLPNSGSTDIEIPTQLAGTTLKGFCGADTYKFLIHFS